MQQADVADLLQVVPKTTPLLSVVLRCTACDDRAVHLLERAFVAPLDAPGLPEGWDGLYVPDTIRCKRCGVEDAYEMPETERVQQSMQHTVGRVFGVGNPRLVMAVLRLFDGTVLRRPSQGLAHLRALIDADPSNGSLWRRLGNYQRRVGHLDDAVESWLHAFQIDDRELEAGHALAQAVLADDRPDEAVHIASLALARLPGCHRDMPQFEAIVARLLDVLKQHAPRTKLSVAWREDDAPEQPVIQCSAVRLEKVRRIATLARFLVTHEVVQVFSTEALPDEEPGRLELWLDDHEDATLQNGVVLNFPTPPGGHRTPRRKRPTGPPRRGSR